MLRQAFFNGTVFLGWVLCLGRGVAMAHPQSATELKFEKIGASNLVERIPGAIDRVERNLSRLPDVGIAHAVWQGSWWPFYSGGMNARLYQNDWSPMEKFDMATKQGGKAVAYEQRQALRFGKVAWAGHCNGLAAAATMTQEPRRAVNYNGVIFYPHDIKALLIKAWNASGESAGARCNQNGSIAMGKDRYGRTIIPECRDINPGAFHLILTNFIGRNKLPVIADFDPSEQVWNFPIVSFRSQIWSINRAQAAQYMRQAVYPYNDEAAGFAVVRTSIRISTSSNTDPNGQRLLSYEYLLELDQGGNINGGEWINGSVDQHPDFVWRANKPNTHNELSNPYLDLNVLNYIHSLSL